MQAELQPDARIESAVDWIITHPVEGRPRATTSVLKELFGLSAKDAVEAIRQANAVRYGLKRYGGADAGSS